ncbi:DUF899 family protein [Ornithinibacillus salinisoli]|uniref:DUF899 family protein n=1 Tax=Ornithinibacillus salinisoli TaxID=1848459 RepID=A0ABW4VYM0_9BACI
MEQLLQEEIGKLEKEIIEKKQKLVELKKSLPMKKVKNYQFMNSTNKTVHLNDLFGDKDELIVVHNMGKGCSYCTMWADGFNGVFHHIVEKAGFVVASPDSPEIQDAFAAERRWQFPMISTNGTTFKEDFGFKDEKNVYPGVSTFKKDTDGQIFHVANAPFGPGDDFCSVWPLFDLLSSGSNDYQPKRTINKNADFQLTNNIAVQVTNYPEAIDFYTNVLGMEIEEVFKKETKLRIGGQHFYIENNETGNTFFEFAVTDFQKTKELLLDNGCEITREYNDESIMVSDPYGLQFHLFERA